MNTNTAIEPVQEKEFAGSINRAAELDKQFEKKTNVKSSEYSPLPLQREAKAAKPYPFEALGVIPGAAARRIHEVIQAPDATCGQSVLAALSLACQGFVDVEVDGRISPTSLFILTISESGERKSSADNVALKAIRDWQRQLVKDHKCQFDNYKSKHEIWKAKRSAAIRDISKGSDDEIPVLENEPQPPCEGVMQCEEPTLEGLEQLLEKGQPSAGIFSDEGGRLVGGHAMNADNALKTACGLSNLWDGKPLTRVRKSEGSKIHYGRRLAVHLMVQPIVLSQLLNNEVLLGQGLLARCLFSAPMPLSGTRTYKEVDLSKDEDVITFYNLLNKILDRPYLKAISESTDSKIFYPGDALEPKRVLLEEDAKQRYMDFHNHTDGKMKQDGEFYSIKPFASKAPELGLKLLRLSNDAMERLEKKRSGNVRGPDIALENMCLQSNS